MSAPSAIGGSRSRTLRISDRIEDAMAARRLVGDGMAGLPDMPKRCRSYAIRDGVLHLLRQNAERRIHPTEDGRIARVVGVIADRSEGRVNVYSMTGSIVALDGDGRRNEAAFERGVNLLLLSMQHKGRHGRNPSGPPDPYRREYEGRRFEPSAGVMATIINDIPNWR